MEIMCVSPPHMVLHYSRSCVLYRFHGASHLPRRPHGTHTHKLMPLCVLLLKDSCANCHHLAFCVPWRPHSRIAQMNKQHSMLHKAYKHYNVNYPVCLSSQVYDNIAEIIPLFFRHQPIPQSYKTIAEEYRWAAGVWWSMLPLLLSALVKHKHYFHF